MTPSPSKKQPANTAIQAMLQKGIDAYMQKKNSSAATAREKRSSTKNQTSTAAPSSTASNTSTPTKDNKTKAPEIPFPLSDTENSEAEKERLLQEEAKEHEEAIALAKANNTHNLR